MKEYINKNLKIINEDCMEIMRKYSDNYFDLAIIDPPYGIERFKKPSGKTRFKSSKLMQEQGLTWDKKPSEKYWNELFRISKNQIIWGANNFILPPSEYFLVWDKKQPVPNFASCEYAWVSMGLKKPAKIFEYSIHKHNHTNKIHPTQKPVKLYEWILKHYAQKEDKILDTHLGSGSSAIASYYYDCKEFVGIEIDEEYYKASIKRIKEQTSQIKLL